jgi:hypothetical protein
MDILLAIQKSRPGAEFQCGETYESIQWLDPVQTPPTREELDAAWTQVQADRAAAAADRTADDAETATLKQMIADLKAGTGTTAQRMARCERVLAHVLKRLF